MPKISALPAVVTPALTDTLPVVQSGVTKKETLQQVKDLVSGSLRTLSDAGTTLTASDQNGTVVFSGSSSVTCVIPKFADAAISLYSIIKIVNAGLSVTVSPDTSVTLVGGAFTFFGSNTYAYIQQTDTDTWKLLNPSELSFWSKLEFNDTSKNLGYSDQFNKQVYNNSSDTTITIQPLLSVPIQIGTTVEYYQLSTGKITFAAGAGVTLISNSGSLSTTNAGDTAKIMHEGVDKWMVTIISGMSSQPSSNVAITGGSISATAFSNKFITESTSGRTLAIADAGSTIYCTNSSTTTVIGIPNNADVPIPVGSYFFIKNATGSQLVQTAVTTATLNYSPVIGNGGIFILKKIATDTWMVTYLYEAVTFSFNWGGAFTLNTQTALLERVNNTVRIKFSETTATATSATSLNTSANVPARFLPDVNTYQTITAVDNVTVKFGNMRIQGSSGGTPGQVNIFAGAGTTSYAGSGSSGFWQFSLVYGI